MQVAWKQEYKSAYGSSQVVASVESCHLSADAYLTGNLTADEDTTPVAAPSGVETVVPEDDEPEVARAHNLVYF